MKSRSFAVLVLFSVAAAGLAGCETEVKAIEQSVVETVKADPSNSDLCPDEPGPDMDRGQPCSLPAGTMCAYRVVGPDRGEGPMVGWAAFSCGCEEDGVWSTMSVTSPGACPDETPTDGTACDPETVRAPCAYFPGDLSVCQSSDTWKTWPEVDQWVCFDQ